MVRLLIFGLLMGWCAQAEAACGPDTAPAPAAARGYTCEIFWDDFTSISTVDVNNTKAPGFKWYVNNGWPGLGGGPAQNLQNVDISPPGDIILDPGGNGLLINPSNNNPLGGATNTLYNMQSCVTNGVANQYIGTTIPGYNGFYMDYTVFSVSPSAGTISGNHWWPVGWMLGVNVLDALDPAPGFLTFAEVDVFEQLNGAPSPPPFGRFSHWWQGNGSGQTDHQARYGQTPTSLNNTTFGVLVVPGAQNGGTGFLRGFINDVIDPNNVDVTWTPGDGQFSNIESNNHCMIFTTGHNQPMVIRSVKVFAPNLLTPPRRGLLK
jgi:hypothetical protein